MNIEQARSLLTEGLRLLIAAIWLAAAVAKARTPPATRESIRRLAALPSWLTGPAAIALPFGEAAIGAFLLFRVKVRVAAGLSAGLFLAFAILIGRRAIADALAARPAGDCGCFGSRTADTDAAVRNAGSAGRGIARNVLLAVVAAVVAGRA